jgi:hypothetical protein
LFLYIATASLTCLLADLQHLNDLHKLSLLANLEYKMSAMHWIIVVINFVLQGFIAWRAFIDDATEKDEKKCDE